MIVKEREMKIEFLGIMQLILITLKLIEKIKISWIKVFIPLYIWFFIFVFLVILEIIKNSRD